MGVESVENKQTENNYWDKFMTKLPTVQVGNVELFDFNGSIAKKQEDNARYKQLEKEAEAAGIPLDALSNFAGFYPSLNKIEINQEKHTISGRMPLYDEYGNDTGKEIQETHIYKNGKLVTIKENIIEPKK